MPVHTDVSYGTTCVPIKGSITATVDSSASGVVEDGILRGMLRVVRQGMIDDIYVSGNIKKVSFIGSRSDEYNSFAPDSFREAEVEPVASVSGIGIAFICIGSVLLLALIALFAIKRRRREAEERDMIFHDATIGAREFDEGGDEDEYHQRGPIVKKRKGLEGADVPGSLANRDELALKPNPSVTMKTGDLDDDTVGSYSPPPKSSRNLTMPMMPILPDSVARKDRVEYMADTQSFDLLSVENGDDVSMAESFLNLSHGAGISLEGAQPAVILDRLNVIAESYNDDEVVIGVQDSDDSVGDDDSMQDIDDIDDVHELKRIM